MAQKEKKQLTIPEREEEILKFWAKRKIFEGSLAKTKKGKEFVFYEGPPTANGMPGIHHVEARAFKDAVLRYKTMRGFHVPRRAGWDTHGLPVEIQVEKKLGIKNKQEIERDIAGFNAEAKKSVWEYKEIWEQLTRRMGFWVDMKHPYITYETSYIESLWWIIKELWKKGLLYEDFKVVPWCPRCQTGLSSHEVGLGYQKDTDTAVIVKFELKPGQVFGGVSSENIAVLAWTTTPWTLPGNVALVIDPEEEYLQAELKEKNDTDFNLEVGEKIIFMGTDQIQKLIFGDELREDEGSLQEVENFHSRQVVNYFGQGNLIFDVIPFRGRDLIGVEYEPLFDVSELRKSKTAYKIYPADFVSATEGTGVVHTAVMYGEDDYQLGKKVGLPTFHTVTEDGKFISEVRLPAGSRTSFGADFGVLGGLSVKAPETTKKILDVLGDKIFHQEPYTHEYPHCWRCATPLLYYARKAWWVKTTAVKEKLLANNEKINWVPKHLKHGRFGEFLRDVRDWCFSRERYWGTPLPIWKCEKCDEIEVIGSTDELKKRGGALPRDEEKKIDLHRPFVDEIIFACAKKDCRGMMRRVPEVADVWFDSGAMPFAQNHYPFASQINADGDADQRRKIRANPRTNPRESALWFPADYICEAVDQTRGWFYSMLNVATLLGRGTPYKNVISLGHVLDAKGQKMSKSKGNVVNPQEMADKYGMDALRWYFFTINAPGDEKRFDEKDVALRQRGFVATLWNSFVFWDTYVKETQNAKRKTQNINILDQWILAKLKMLVVGVTWTLDKYDLVYAARAIDEFTVNDFSQWYVRRSRRRFQHPETSQEKNEAMTVMARVLLALAELSAPFAPFISEAVYQGLCKRMSGLREESVHLRAWPKQEAGSRKQELGGLAEMETARAVVAEALKLRAGAGIKVRQPLASLQISSLKFKKSNRALLELIKDEVNVKEILFGDATKLDTEITPELREEGMAREIIRNIQEMRRELHLAPKQRVDLLITHVDAVLAIEVKYGPMIQKETNSRIVVRGVGRKPSRAERALQFADGELRIEIL